MVIVRFQTYLYNLFINILRGEIGKQVTSELGNDFKKLLMAGFSKSIIIVSGSTICTIFFSVVKSLFYVYFVMFESKANILRTLKPLS